MVHASFAALLGFLPFVLAKTHTVEFTVKNARISPDGFERSAVTINGQFPGPLVQINKNDHIIIPTHNRLTDPSMRRSTAIHWHGFFQARTSAMDGVSFVGQCPIPPSTAFTYEFTATNQRGNFWYHSHLSTQYCDGLRGPFVVYDPDDPSKHMYDVDDATTVITLADWYHTLAPVINQQILSTREVPPQDSALINGRGRYNGGPKVPYAVINVERGKRYRLRVFALSCHPFFTFSVDRHNITFFEADGVLHDPVVVQNIDIHAGQRVSAILNANQPVGNYWIRAPAELEGVNPNYNASLSLAILRYKGAKNVEPTTTNVPGHALLDTEMHPIAAERPGKLGSGPPDRAFVFDITQPKPPFWDINGISYVSPTIPVLLQLLSGAKKPLDLLPSDQVFVIPRNSLIEVTFPGGGGHPFHLHGHTFDVVLPANEVNPNYKNPLRRDVYPILGGNTTFRFFTDNPGAWFLHCHVDWHLETGLAIVFAEAPEDNVSGPQSQIITQEWKGLCPAYDKLDPSLQ